MDPLALRLRADFRQDSAFSVFWQRAVNCREVVAVVLDVNMSPLPTANDLTMLTKYVHSDGFCSQRQQPETAASHNGRLRSERACRKVRETIQ